MGRRQDQATGEKVTKEDGGKSLGKGRVRKQTPSKPVVTENIRRGPVPSKAGFTLYSEPSEAAKSMRLKSHKSFVSTKKQPQIDKKVEENFLQQTEVVSQMQIQTELVKAEEATGIIIPAADYETDGDGTYHGEDFDHQEFGTPFNKRLVSSTPDPERLLEAELLENLESQPSIMYPQMIPERDTTQSITSSTVLTTVASSLSEKLKIQRQKFQENQQILQKQQQQSQNQWQQQPQQYQHTLPEVQHFHNVLKYPNFQPHDPNNELLTVTPSHVSVTKAEWIVGEHQDLKKSKATSTFVHSTKLSDSNSASLLNNSSVDYRFGATVSETGTNTGTVYDNSSAQKKIFSKITHPDIPVSSDDNMLYPAHAPAHVQSSIKTSQSQLTDDDHDQHSHLKYPSLTTEKVSDFSSDNCNINDRLDRYAKRALLFEKPGSAFSKLETSSGTSNHITSTSNLHYSTGQTFPELGTSSSENVLSRSEFTEWNVKAKSPRKVVTDKPSGQNEAKSSLRKTDQNNTKFRERGKSSLKSKTHLGEAKREENQGVPPIINKVPQLDDHLMLSDFDTSGDTCDMEVSNVLLEQKSDRNVDMLNKEIDSKREEDTSRKSSASDATNLSQVIEFLKSDAFNKVKEYDNECMRYSNQTNFIMNDIDIGLQTADSKIDKKQSGLQTTDSTIDKKQSGLQTTDSKLDKKQSGLQTADLKIEKNQSCDDDTLAELMRHYLPETDKNNVNDNSNNYIVNDTHNRGEDADESCTKTDVDININQNHFNDEDQDYEMQSRPKHLRYLERMADPILRDIACRLSLKATALRDVELRDLIDDMIFHTDAALGCEDARLQSTQMIFARENNKLKKRIQSINQQLDAKERQEKLGNNQGLSNNEALHLEKKIMYLSQEKEKLDDQVTVLLEEKAKWLITQQDLVRAISLKDHEMLKLEEKHHEEKNSLLQSLDQATKNSQGVHYKLSVADREISNLEQSIRSRNVEIMNLKEKLREAEGKLLECERYSKLKDQEMLRLQDLVDALKIGVDHVLQAYESSCSKEGVTINQRQGMENLHQMVHPEEYRLSDSILSDAREAPQALHTVPIRGPHYYKQTFSSSQRTALPKEISIRPEHHYTGSRSLQHQKHHSMEDASFRAADQSELRSRKDFQPDTLPKRLTFKTLEEHNRCLSPVDRTLWRSLDNEPRVSRILGEDPYYSDSEIEVNSHRRRQSSLVHHRNAADNLQQRSRIPHFNKSQRQSAERKEQFPSTYDGNCWDEPRNSQSTKFSTIRSETIPKSVDTHEISTKDPFSEETYYSSLRSEPLYENTVHYQNHDPSVHYSSNVASDRDHLRPNDQCQTEYRKGSSHIHERDSVEMAPNYETRRLRSLSISHPSERPSQKHSINQRNIHHYSLGHEYGHVPETSMPEHSKNLMDREVPAATLQPEYLSFDPHRVSQRRMETFPHTDIETEECQDFDQDSHPNYPSHREHPFNSTTHPDHERLKNLSRRGLISHNSPPHPDHSYPGRHSQETYLFNDRENSPYSRQSVLLNGGSSWSSPANITDISISRRATRDSDNITQREFFQGTELSASVSSISEADIPSTNNNQLGNLNENPFSSGITLLDEKIASLQRKIDRTKAMFS